MNSQKLQSFLVVFILAICPWAAKAEKIEMDDLKAYLTQAKQKTLHPLDAYVFDKETKKVKVSEIAKGRAVLLHFWATWCGPCVQELPSLAELSQKMDKSKIITIAVSEDFGGIPKVTKFLEKHQIKGLEAYTDVMTALANSQEVQGLPVTILIAPDGKLLARVDGPVHWDDTKFQEDFLGEYAPNAKANAPEMTTTPLPEVPDITVPIKE